MAWNGSGTFSRTNGDHTGTNTWQQDATDGIKIRADRHDVHDQDLSDGINACIAKNGENAFTGNADLGSNKITNLAAGSAASDGVRYDQVLLLGGGTMTGNIAMSGTQKLTGLAAGSTNGDSVRYEQVLLLAGGTMAGNIAMGTNKLTGLAAGSSNGDSVRYEQVLLLSGGTMAGNIAMGTNKLTGLAAGTTNGDSVRYEQISTLKNGWVPLAVNEPSGVSTSNFTSLITSDYDVYAFVFALDPTATSTLYVRTSTDNGSTWDSGASDYRYAVRGADDNGTLTTRNSVATTEIHLTAQNSVPSGGNDITGILYLYRPLDASYVTRCTFQLAYINASSYYEYANGFGQRHSIGDVDAFQFGVTSGNFAGTITMYGISSTV